MHCQQTKNECRMQSDAGLDLMGSQEVHNGKGVGLQISDNERFNDEMEIFKGDLLNMNLFDFSCTIN